LVRYSILARFPLKKSTKGVPKRWKTNLHQIYSLKPRVIWYYKGSVAILFWDEKRLCLGSGGLNCENSVPKFERESHPDHWGGRLTPNFVDHLVMFIKHGLHQKVTFQDVCSVDPLWCINCIYNTECVYSTEHSIAVLPVFLQTLIVARTAVGFGLAAAPAAFILFKEVCVCACVYKCACVFKCVCVFV